MVKHTLSDVLCVEIKKSLNSGISKKELEQLVSKEIALVNLEEYIKNVEKEFGIDLMNSKILKAMKSSTKSDKRLTKKKKPAKRKKLAKRKVFKRVFDQKSADIANARTPEQGHFKAVTGMLAAGFMASQKFSTKQIAKFLQKHNIPKYGLSNRGYKHIKVSDGSYYRHRSITQMLQRYNPRNYKAFMDENNQHGFISLGKAEGFKLIGNVPMALESRDPALWHELLEMTTKPGRKKYPLYHGYTAKQKKSK